MNILLVAAPSDEAARVAALLRELAVGQLATVADPAAALARLAQGGVDVVLWRPAPDAADAAALAALAAQAPLVVLADGEDESLARAALRAGAQDCLAGPRATGPALRRALQHAIERRKAEQALRTMLQKSRELLQIVNQSPSVAFLWRAAPGWPVENVSENIRQFGYLPEEFYSGAVTFQDLLHPDDAERFQTEADYYGRAQAETFVRDYRLRTRDGRVRWIDDRTWIRRDAAGRITHYQGLVLDVTERRDWMDALARHLRYEEALSACSQVLLAHEENDEALRDALQILLKVTGASHIALVENRMHGTAGPDLHPLIELAAAGLPRGRRRAWPARQPYRPVFARWEEQLARGQPIMGQAPDLPAEEQAFLQERGVQAVLAMPVTVGGAWHGFLGLLDTRELRLWTTDDLHLLRTTASMIGSFLERHELQQAMLEIAGREQRRIGQDLHDSLGQHLTALAFRVKILEQQLLAQGRPETATAAEIGALVNMAIREAHGLAMGLNPVSIHEEGLHVALENLAQHTQAMFGVACIFKNTGPVVVRDHAAALHLFRIAQEAVNNAIRHGRSTQVRILLKKRGDEASLAIRDNGHGILSANARQRGMGLRIMRTRARMIAGRLVIRGVAGKGTVIACRFPLTPAWRLAPGPAAPDL